MYAKNRFVFLSKTAAKHPHSSDAIAAKIKIGCHNVLRGSTASVKNCIKKAKTVILTGSIKNPVITFALPS